MAHWVEWFFNGIGSALIPLLAKNKKSARGFKPENKNRVVQLLSPNSTVVQINGGIQLSIPKDQAKEIAVRVFRENFMHLSEKADRIACMRIKTLVDDFIDRLYDESLDLIERLEEPAIQAALYNVQREYAKTGDDELKEQQIELLMSRINAQEHSLRQIVLDEAILTVSKISQDQFDFMAFIFMIDNLTTDLLHKELEKEGNLIDTHDFFCRIVKFCNVQSKAYRRHMVNHLLYLGCVREVLDSGHYFDSPVIGIKTLLSRHIGKEVSDDNIVRVLYSIDKNLSLYYRIWNMRKERSIKLTTVGLVIAITYYNKRFRSDIRIEDFI